MPAEAANTNSQIAFSIIAFALCRAEADHKDVVSVTALTRRGDREVVVLEETGEKTGVFEGSIATTLDIGDPAAGVLSLFDGEKINLIYVDQARANGAKDVEVKLTMPTAASVTTVVAGK